LRRIDGKYLLQEIGSVLSFDRGFFYTIRELAVNPGGSVREFLMEERKRLIKPVLFLILTSIIYTLANNVFHFEDGYVRFEGNADSATSAISNWVRSNYGYANMIMALFIGLWTKIFFRKQAFNIFEILVLLCFVMGMGMLIYSVFGIMQSLTGVKLLQAAVLGGFVYMAWAIGQFYGGGKFIHYVKAFLAYLLGMITFSLASLLLGMSIDALS
jgi:hypothetical protein